MQESGFVIMQKKLKVSIACEIIKGFWVFNSVYKFIGESKFGFILCKKVWVYLYASSFGFWAFGYESGFGCNNFYK